MLREDLNLCKYFFILCVDFLLVLKSKNTSKVNLKLFQKALDVQKMRGPDFSNVISEHNYFFGHNRLSILDQDPRSNQPYNKNKYFSLIYNGEIYNIKELREFLFRHNINLESNCDTEILYELLINFGIERTMSLIEGMYAFVFIDKKMDRVVGGRDKFGQKPIFYLADNTDIIFSSSINSIRVLKPSLKINSQAIENYLASQVHILTSETFFSNVLPLNAGHFFILENNKIETKRYFAVEDLIETNPYNCSEAQALEDIEKI